jgi:hypothetical protein
MVIERDLPVEVDPTASVKTIQRQSSYLPNTVGLDLPLDVEFDGQVLFNIFETPVQSNLFINNSTYFEGESYIIQNTSGSWKLQWLNEFELTLTDTIVLRKYQ